MESKNEENASEKRKIPPAAPFIWINLMLERFSTNGISGWWIGRRVQKSQRIFVVAILALYLYRKLHFDQSTATAIYHTEELLAYLFTIIGAIIADSWLGVYRTILWMTLVFAVGTGVVAVTAIEQLNIPIL